MVLPIKRETPFFNGHDLDESGTDRLIFLRLPVGTAKDKRQNIIPIAAATSMDRLSRYFSSRRSRSGKTKDTKGKGKDEAIERHTVPLGDLPKVPRRTLELDREDLVDLSFGDEDGYVLTRASPGAPIILRVPKDKAHGRMKGSYELYYGRHLLKLGSYIEARANAEGFSVKLYPEKRIANVVRKIER